MTLAAGLIGAAELKASSETLVPAFGPRFPSWSGMPPVAASVMLIGLMEEACVRIVHPRLAQGQTTLGADIDFKHLAPSPEGLLLRARAELVEVSGSKLTFEATCHDDFELVGRMRHVRVIVSQAQFEQGLERKHPR